MSGWIARTTDHLFILKCISDTYCNSKDGRVFACFVDFQKAFDTVIHTHWYQNQITTRWGRLPIL